MVIGACASPQADRNAPKVGAYAPDFELVDISGNIVRLSDFRGQPVLINFWATWCPPCLLEMPGIQSRYETHYPNLVVLAIDVGEDKEVVEAYSQYVNLPFNPLVDTNTDVARLYQIRGNPTSFFIDAEGIIKVMHIGMMTEEALDRNLAEIGLK
jgi:peroxiredoxin